MNPQSQAFETVRAPSGESMAGDRRRLLALSVAAVLLIDAGLGLLLLDDDHFISMAAAIVVQKSSAPGHDMGRWDDGKGR